MHFLNGPRFLFIAVVISLLWHTSEAPAHQEFMFPDNGASGEAFSAGAIVNSGLDVSLAAQEVQAANAGRDVILRGTTVRRNVAAGRQIQATDCTVQGSLSAGRDVELNHCRSVMRVTAGRDVSLSGTRVESGIEAGHRVRLNDSSVEGDVKAGSGADLKNSRIAGTLYLTTDRLRLDGSRVTHIRIGEAYSMVAQGGSTGISINSNGNSVNIGTGVNTGSIIGNNSIQVQGGGIVSRNGFIGTGNGMGNAMISVGPSSVSNVNGYTVKGASDRTTVITPQGSIYVNGARVSGLGPKTYREFVAMNPDAPAIRGPGWVSGGAAPVSSSPGSEVMPEQVIELVNNSVIAGEVVFEGGNGKILIHPGSEFHGTVRGGVIEKHR